MEKAFEKIAFLIIFVTLPVVILLSSVEFVTFDLDFYNKQYEENHVVENTEIEKDELMHITGEMLDYLKGNRENLEIYGQVNGEKQLIFDERDQAHMVDVEKLFSRGLLLRNISLILLVVSFIYLAFYKREKRKTAKAVLYSAIFTIATFVILGVIVSTDFSRYFDIFHYIFFDNDLWQLDPKKSILINLLPLGFFQSIVVKMLIYFLGSLVIAIFLSGWYLRKHNKRKYIFSR